MRVQRLHIQSFRGIKDLMLEFDPSGSTVLIGINGSGKSSVLDCLAVLLSWFVSAVRAKKIGNIKASQGGKFLDSKDITNGVIKTSAEILVSFNSKEVRWSLQRKNLPYSSIGNISDSELDKVFKEIHQQLAKQDDYNLPVIVYYSVNRIVLDTSLDLANKNDLKQTDTSLDLVKNIEFKQMATYDKAFEVKNTFHQFFQWFRWVEDLENEQRRDEPEYRNPQLEAVRQAIGELLDGFSNLRVRRSPLRMTISKQGEELVINQLSHGEKGLLALAGDLARRLAIANPGLTNPLEGSGVVMIDEIELHLHPAWQRKVLPSLTQIFPNCQFIVTTHSPQVISHVHPQQIYLLEATPDGVIASHPDSSYGRDSNRILEDLMGVPERPQAIKDQLLQLFRLIDQGDLAGAKQLRQQLAEEIGADEPEFVRADVLIRRREVLNR